MKAHNMLFNSKKSPIPEVRREINLVPIQDNGRSLLYVQDPYGYAAPDFALDEGVRPLLGLIDGYKSVNDLKPYLGEQLDAGQLLEFIQFLDEKCLLNSSYFHYFSSKTEKEYEAEPIHRAITAGNSYPADPAELTNYLDDAFRGNGSPNSGAAAVKALYAPHIDPRVGMQSYVKAFSSIAHTRP
ncbi:MAG: AmmeMemoRadiSam system protein B, partial [Balneolaceae bacterium]